MLLWVHEKLDVRVLGQTDWTVLELGDVHEQSLQPVGVWKVWKLGSWLDAFLKAGEGETEGRDPGHRPKIVSTHPQPIKGSHGAEHGSSVGSPRAWCLRLWALTLVQAAKRQEVTTVCATACSLGCHR